MEIYMGVDWSTDSAVCTFGDVQKQQKQEILPHPQQVEQLLENARQLVPKADVIRVALEAGSPLWLRLFSQAGALVHLVDGKQSKRFVESMHPGGAKDDVRDSDSMFELAMSPKHRGKAYTPPSEEMRTLEKLTSIHERWVAVRTAEVQRLRQQLVNTLLPISKALPDLTKKFALAFLEKYPTPKEVCNLSKKRFDAFAKKHRLKQVTREKLWPAIGQCFDLLGEQEAQLQAMLIRQLVQRIRSLQETLNEVEAKIEELYHQSEESETLASIKGIGTGLGALLVSQVLSTDSEKRDGASIRMGSSPLTKQSGKKKGKKGKKAKQKKQVRMRKSVPSRLRRATYLLGMQIVKWHDWAKAQYNSMIEKGKNSACAYRAVTRSMLRIIRALLRDGKQYDRDVYVRALQAKGVEWAMGLPLEQ